MTLYVAPEALPVPVQRSVFLAGGISNCPDWQSDLVDRFTDQNLTANMMNPRRFGNLDETEAVAQITWEFHALKYSEAVLFWFPEETLCPITLFELGTFMPSDKTLFVGTHPGYMRKVDVVTQVGLARPNIEVVHSLDDLTAQVLEWDNSFNG
jgi:hypothetical protein